MKYFITFSYGREEIIILVACCDMVFVKQQQLGLKEGVWEEVAKELDLPKFHRLGLEWWTENNSTKMEWLPSAEWRAGE